MTLNENQRYPVVSSKSEQGIAFQGADMVVYQAF